MSKNFKLVDSEMENAGNKILVELSESQKAFNRYLQLLEEVCTRGFIEGKTNKALLKFHNELAGIFRGKFTEVGADVETLCKSFVQEADRLDEDLYN